MSLADSIHRTYRLVARSRPATAFCARLRSQCDAVVAYHLNDGIDPECNGEAWLSRTLAPRCSLFVDVGANVGEWSRTLLNDSPKAARGALYEPAESAMAKLRAAFGDNPRVELTQAAVSDFVGTASFYEEPNAGLTSSLVAGFSTSRARQRVLPVTTLDTEAEKLQWDRVDFLKIDAEGHDFNVIRGSSTLLEQHRIGVVQFEYNAPWKQTGATLAGAISFLNRHGYRTYLLRSNGLIPFDYDRWGEYFGYSNFVSLSPQMHAELVQSALVPQAS